MKQSYSNSSTKKNNGIAPTVLLAPALFLALVAASGAAAGQSGTPTTWGRIKAAYTVEENLRSATAVTESYSRFPVGQCTWWSAKSFDQTAPYPDCNWGGNADAWVGNAFAAGWRVYGPMSFASPTASLHRGCLVVWNGGGYGHVAYIESVTSTGLNISEMNWPIGAGVTYRFLGWAQVAQRGSYSLAGYVLNVRR
jgi:surface antigen